MRALRPFLYCLAFAASTAFLYGQSIEVIGEPVLGPVVIIGINDCDPSDRLEIVGEPVLGPIILLAGNFEVDESILPSNQPDVLNDDGAEGTEIDSSPLPRVANVPILVISQPIPAPTCSPHQKTRDQVCVRIKHIEVNSKLLKQKEPDLDLTAFGQELNANQPSSGVIESAKMGESVDLLIKEGVAKIVAQPSATVDDGKTIAFHSNPRTNPMINIGLVPDESAAEERIVFSLFASPHQLADGKIRLNLVADMIHSETAPKDTNSQKTMSIIEAVVDIRSDQSAYLIAGTKPKISPEESLNTTSLILIVISAEKIAPILETEISGGPSAIPVGDCYFVRTASATPIADLIKQDSILRPDSDGCGQPGLSGLNLFCQSQLTATAQENLDFLPGRIASSDSEHLESMHPDRIAFHLNEVAKHLMTAGLPDEAEKIRETERQILIHCSNQLRIAYYESKIAALQAEVARLKASNSKSSGE